MSLPDSHAAEPVAAAAVTVPHVNHTRGATMFLNKLSSAALVLTATLATTLPAIAQDNMPDGMMQPPSMPMMGPQGPMPMMQGRPGGMPMMRGMPPTGTAMPDETAGDMPMAGCRHHAKHMKCGGAMMGGGKCGGGQGMRMKCGGGGGDKQPMQERRAMMEAHMQKMEQRLANIESLLQQMLDLQKR